LNSNTFKNMVIVFGMAISLFTIISFDSVSQADATSTNIENQEINENSIVSQARLNDETNTSESEQKLKTHHNFIASYLLQESSVKRKSKKPKVQGDLIGHIIHLHKIILTKAVGFF